MRRIHQHASALIAVATLTFSTIANATVFNINRSIGNGGSVVGSVSTDGTLGQLATSNITAWTLKLSEGGDTFDLIAGNSEVLVTSAGLSATATELWFNFSASGYVLFQNSPLNSGNPFWCLQGPNNCATTFSGESVRASAPLTPFESSPYSGLQLIATVAPIPEPSTFALYLLGVTGMVLGSRQLARANS